MTVLDNVVQASELVCGKSLKKFEDAGQRRPKFYKQNLMGNSGKELEEKNADGNVLIIFQVRMRTPFGNWIRGHSYYILANGLCQYHVSLLRICKRLILKVMDWFIWQKKFQGSTAIMGDMGIADCFELNFTVRIRNKEYSRKI